jgi:tRNA (guanine10-N2)-dimethyltransferase
MDLIFYLSGEQQTLPKSEALSFLQNQGWDHEIIEDLEQLLVCRISPAPDLRLLENLGMTHSVLEYIGFCEPEIDEILKLAGEIKKIKESFSVRVERIKKYSKNQSTLELERSIGDEIDGKNVDLRNPDIAFVGFLTSNRFVLGKTLLKINRGDFEKRNPQFRPYFHPSSLLPIFSRTLCNICGVAPNKLVLDPFCGTGGILIEAGLIGAEIHGLDLDKSMVEGCIENLAHFGLSGKIELGDATEINAREEFDIVITDPPYGRASTTMGRSLESLYKKAVNSIFQALKKKGKACIISPDTLPLEEIVTEIGFTVRETHLLRVHKSLTRKIVILKK